MNERPLGAIAPGLRRPGALGSIPLSRQLDESGPSGGVVVQIKVLTKDTLEYQRVSNQVQKALNDARIENVTAYMVSSEQVEMTTVDVAAIAKAVMPELLQMMNIDSGMVRR